jgi:Bacterial regulatory proteins, gntR family
VNRLRAKFHWERIPERELDALFHVSCTPLREALKLLYAEGLVFLLPNRGSRAAKLATEGLHSFLTAQSKRLLEANGCCPLQIDSGIQRRDTYRSSRLRA